jgi:hypothetical protein
LAARHARRPGRIAWAELDVGAASEDLDHVMTADERRRIAMARQ